MSIAKENKRIIVTLDPQTIKMLDIIISTSRNAVRTRSEAIKFSVNVACQVLAEYNKDNECKEEN